MEIETKTLSSKKLARLEKKQKKMLAYLEVAKLNDEDRDRVKHPADDKNDVSLSGEDEPSCKKLKTDPWNFTEITSDNQKTDVTIMSKKYSTISGKPLLSGDEYAKLKQTLKERRTKLRQLPSIRLKDVGSQASISMPVDDRTPIFLSDIQHLILFTALGNHSPYFPQRWCTMEKQSRIQRNVVIVIENMSLNQYLSQESHFEHLGSTFDIKLEVVTPTIYKGDLVEEISAVPLTSTQKEKLVKEYGNLEAALSSYKVFNMLKAVFPVHDRIKLESERKMIIPGGDKFPRTHLLLSPWQMVEENYPLPLKGTLKNKYASYVMTKDKYEEVTPTSPMYAIDCEMCVTTIRESELTRVSVVNEQHESIYESFVKPYNKIIDYVTQFSGITKEMLEPVTTRIEDVQREIRDMLPPDAILVGQSLNSDLHALKMMHPYIIDTSVIFNVTGDRLRKTKLKTLTKEFLDEVIQDSDAGHCSIEDSISSLKLVQLKLKHYIEFGDAVLSGQKGCLKTYRLQGDNYYGSSLLHHVTKIDKKAFVVASMNNTKKYNKYIHTKETGVKRMIECAWKQNNEGIVKHACEKIDEYDLSLVHLSVGITEENNIEQTCKTVDRWIKTIWSCLGANSMCMVVFGGNVTGNGACFIQIKKDNQLNK